MNVSSVKYQTRSREDLITSLDLLVCDLITGLSFGKKALFKQNLFVKFQY